MSNLTPTSSLNSLPNELILEIFDHVDMLKDGGRFLLVNRSLHVFARQVANHQAQVRLKKCWDTSTDGKNVTIKDLNLQVVGVCKRGNLSPVDQLLRIERREKDWEMLCHLFENFLCLSSCDSDGIVDMVGESRYYIDDLAEKSRGTGEGVLDIFHALEDLHYEEFATIDLILKEVGKWPEIQLLQFALMSQALGQFLYLVQGVESSLGADDHHKIRIRFEYMQAAKLVLLLWGARPLLLAIVNAVEAHPSPKLREAVLIGMHNRLANAGRDLRRPRYMEPGMLAPGWQWTFSPVGRNTFNAALWHVRTYNSILEDWPETPAYPALFTGGIPIGDGPDEFSRQMMLGDFGRPDLLVDDMMAHMMGDSEWTWLEDPYHLQNAIDAR